ncbi:MAG: TatD family hydrolase [Methanobrevibacter sp.]|jgi:predicted metal-dependent TIM-barrel fold hydrolase|nr:TatD family hydrolase [Candidatus Methanovirga basalitermitum]
MIDSHLHGDSRSVEDYEKMSIGGIREAISCSYYPYKITKSSVLITHFKRILYFEKERAEREGIKLNIALGIHPVNVFPKYKLVIEEIEKSINKQEIVAIGEIGLETMSPEEVDIFTKQILIADETKTKVIIHTPRQNKLNTLKKTKEILSENIDPKLVVIDHINSTVVDEVIDEGYLIGLTVQPEKMTSVEAVNIIHNYGFNKFMLNSDSSYSKSDVLSVPKTARLLRIKGYKEKDIEKVSKLNAKNFFKSSS